MEQKCEYSKIFIPIDHKYSDIASDYAATVAKKLGFDQQSILEIKNSIDQAISWVIDYSFEKYEKESIELSCELIPQGLKIVIKDKGLPFDSTRLNESRSETLSKIFDLKKYLDETGQKQNIMLTE